MLRKLIHLPQGMLVPPAYRILIRSQIGIVSYETYVSGLGRTFNFRLSGWSLLDWSLLGCGLLCYHGEKALCLLLYFMKPNSYSASRSHSGRLRSPSRSCPVR